MQTSLSPPLDPTLHSASIFRLFVLSVRKMKAIKCYNIHSFYFPRKNIISKIFITLIKSYVDDYFRISCYKLNPTPPLSTKSSPKLKGCPSFNVMKVFLDSYIGVHQDHIEKHYSFLIFSLLNFLEKVTGSVLRKTHVNHKLIF